MLDWFRKKSDEYISEYEYARMKVRVAELEAELKDVKEGYVAKLDGDVKSSKFELDFSTMQVFSIERNHNGVRAYTTIGYFVDKPGEFGVEPTVCEWTLYCSMEEHERLVMEFRKWIDKKGKK